jgi:hypothetical protein
LREGSEVRHVEWGELNVAFKTVPSGFDAGPLLRGFPDGACHCPHWGYVFSGKIVVRYSDGEEETVTPGQAYYWRPGHVPFYPEETEVLELSPKEKLKDVMEGLVKESNA